MNTFSAIVLACLAGGVLSAAAAALVAWRARREWIPTLVSFAVGALLGAAFLELLPHAFESATDFKQVAGTVLAGIVGFFILEKLVIWRHHHDHGGEEGAAHAHHHDHGHGHDGGRSGLLIIIGDSFHNFVDGVLIAAAFMESTALGVVAATAVIAHEIPQEVGDFLVLLHSGYTKLRAFLWNLVASLAMLVGGVVGYFGLETARDWSSTLIALAAASMIYVAVADLIPGLHRRAALGSTLTQVLLIALGVALIAGVGHLAH